MHKRKASTDIPANRQALIALLNTRLRADAWHTIGDIDTSQVTDMHQLFSDVGGGGSIPTLPSLANWDTSNVRNMYRLFADIRTPISGIREWNTARVTTMESMFEGATAFNEPIQHWNMTSVTTIEHMFSGATAFNQPLDAWDLRNATCLRNCFHRTAYEQPITWTLRDDIDPFHRPFTIQEMNNLVRGWIYRSRIHNDRELELVLRTAHRNLSPENFATWRTREMPTT